MQFNLLTYNTSFVNSWYMNPPFTTSEYALIRTRRNKLFAGVKSQIDLKPQLLEENEEKVAKYYRILYDSALHICKQFLNEEREGLFAVALQEQNCTNHALESISKILPSSSYKVVQGYIKTPGGVFPSLVSVFKLPAGYSIIASSNDQAKHVETPNKNQPSVDSSSEMSIFDLGTNFKKDNVVYKKPPNLDDDGRPMGIVRIDFDSSDTTIFHFNSNLPNPSALKVDGEGNTILEMYEAGVTVHMKRWADIIIEKINAQTQIIGSFYNDPIKTKIVVLFSGDFNDPYGVLMNKLKEVGININGNPIAIAFNEVLSTCCANLNSIKEEFNPAKKGILTTNKTNFKPENYSDGFDKNANYKFQGDNNGIGFNDQPIKITDAGKYTYNGITYSTVLEENDDVDKGDFSELLDTPIESPSDHEPVCTYATLPETETTATATSDETIGGRKKSRRRKNAGKRKTKRSRRKITR